MRLLLPSLVLVLVAACSRENPVFGAGDSGTGESGKSDDPSIGSDPSGDPSGDPSSDSLTGSGTSTATTASSTGMEATTDPNTMSGADTLEPPMSCCEKHGTPGCDDGEVEQCVCEAMGDCCEVGWSQDCVTKARSCGGECMHGTTGGSDTSSSGAEGSSTTDNSGGSSSGSSGTTGATPCCEASAIAGCVDDPLAICVCAIDNNCCKDAWDENCVGTAIEDCGLVCG